MIKSQKFSSGTIQDVWAEALVYIQDFPQQHIILDVVVNYIQYAMTEAIWTITIYFK